MDEGKEEGARRVEVEILGAGKEHSVCCAA